MQETGTVSRRLFVAAAGICATSPLGRYASAATPAAYASAEPETSEAVPNPRDCKRPLRLALASYTLRKFSLQEALAMTRRVGLNAICLKSFHLPLEASKEQIEAAKRKVTAAGIKLYGGGVIPMRTESQLKRAFQYAKAAGMERIIGVPAPELLKLLERHVRQYGIEVAIHNHGPGDRLYPTPLEIYSRIKGLDRRIGICHDVGHTARVGKDPVAVTKQCADRVLGVHLKDVTEPTRMGRCTPCGRGIIDLPALLRTLLEVGDKGYVSFEYESEPSDPLPGLAESVGYVRGVLDAL